MDYRLWTQLELTIFLAYDATICTFYSTPLLNTLAYVYAISMCVIDYVWYMSQITFTNRQVPRNSVVNFGELLRSEPQNVRAVSTECPCSVRGTYVLGPQFRALSGCNWQFTACAMSPVLQWLLESPAVGTLQCKHNVHLLPVCFILKVFTSYLHAWPSLPVLRFPQYPLFSVG